MNKALKINARIEKMAKDGFVLRKWSMGNTNFRCEVCGREHFPANPIYISAALTEDEIAEDPAGTCELVLGTGCAKKVKAMILIPKLGHL